MKITIFFFIKFQIKSQLTTARQWLDILNLEGALLGLMVILYFDAFANRFIVFCTTEVMHLDLIITNYAQNSRYKI